MSDSITPKSSAQGDARVWSTGQLQGAIGLASPQDELLHAPPTSGHYSSTETSYFGFNIPERQINGEIYIWFHPVLRMMSAGVYIWRGLKRSTLAAEYSNHHHFLPWPAGSIDDYRIPELGLHIRVLIPLTSIQIELDDSARGVRLSLRLDAVSPACLRPGGFHFVQAMKTNGLLEMDGESMPIQGYFSRDRSWGKERREDALGIPPLTWMVGIFDERFAFHALAHDDPGSSPEWRDRFPAVLPGKNLVWGYIFQDGEVTPLAAVRKLTKREADGLAPCSIDLELVDALHRTFAIRGTVQARLPWQTWQNVNVFFCQMRWVCGSSIGFGDAQDVQFGQFIRQFSR